REAARAMVHHRRCRIWSIGAQEKVGRGGLGAGGGEYDSWPGTSAGGAGVVIWSMSVGVMIPPPEFELSQLPCPRPDPVDLVDLRRGLRLLSQVECEGLAVRPPGRPKGTVGRADGLLDVEEGRGVEPGGRRPHVGQLPAGMATVAVEPDVRSPRLVAHGECDVVVARI